MVIAGRLGFGIAAEAGGGQTLMGWAEPEDGFAWTVGEESRFVVDLSGGLASGMEAVLELDLNPFVPPGSGAGQMLSVFAGGLKLGEERILGEGTVAYRLPAHAVASGRAVVTLRHPEASRPADLGFNDDPRVLGFMIREARVLHVDALREPRERPHALPPLAVADTLDWPALRDLMPGLTGLSGEALAEGFESLGHNCEFGMVQRHCGIEPLALFRFAGITLPDLLTGLDCGFEGLGEESEVEALLGGSDRREFLVRDRRHRVTIHTMRFEDETTADVVRREQSGQLRFFHRVFMETLESGERIFVCQRPGQTTLSQMLPLLLRLRAYGPNALLFVTGDAGQPAGSVEQLGYGWFRGAMHPFAPQGDVGNCNMTAWMSLCFNARRLWSAQRAEAVS